MRFIRKCIMAAGSLLVFLGSAQAQSIKIGSNAVWAGGSDSQKGNRLSAQIAYLPQAAIIQSLTIYVFVPSGNLILGIYDAGGPGGGPGALKASTASFTPITGWNAANVVRPVSLAAGNYWLAFLPSSNSLGILTYPAGNCKYYSYGFASLPSTFSASPASCTPAVWSFYATLTVVPTGVAGKCGPMNGLFTNAGPNGYSYPPLCAAGSESAVGGRGPWFWTCNGTNGGANASCQAPVETTQPIDSSAAANWRSAGMLSVGGIPNRTAVCKTLSPLGAGKDDSANIQNAIESCPAGQVVMLSSGTFTIAEGNLVFIDKGVTLRGAGPGATILTRTGGAKLGSYAPGANPSAMVVLGPKQNSNTQTATKLTADGPAGQSFVQVASASGLAVGQIVLVDEASGAGWQHDVEGLGSIWAAPDYRVVWQKHYPPQPNFDDFTATQYPYQAGTGGCWFSNCDRPTSEYHKIAHITGDTITFDSPLTISYRVSQQAQLHYFQTPFTQQAGLERLTVQYGDKGNIAFQWCAYCWAYNVESTLWLGDGFGINSSFRVELNEFYAHKPVWPVPGGGGYNISLANGSSEILIWNGVSVLANKVMVSRSSGAGSVTAYNYMDMGFISGSDGWQEAGLNNSHFVGSHHMLFEGNYSFNIDSDQTHGNSIYNTFFRNYTTGFRAKFTDYLNNVAVNDIAQQSTNGPLRTASVHAYGYWDSLVGNVFGVPGQMGGFIYGDANEGPSNFPPQIYMMGWNDLPNQIYDPAVISTALIDGNYDFVTDRVLWTAKDTAHTLPASLFLTGKPAFFSVGVGYTWPWVNPTQAPLFYKLPAKARYDAGTPFKQP
jgi:hypothetical protein